MRFNDYRPIEKDEDVFTSGLPNTNLFLNNDYVNNFDPMLPRNYAQLMNLLPVMNTQERENWLRLMDVKQIIRSNLQSDTGVDYTALEGSHRIWWFPCANFIENDNTALDASRTLLQNGKMGSDIGQIVISGISGNERINSPEEVCIQNQFSYSILEINPQSMTLKVSTSKDGWLMVGNSWYPGWMATIDGKETDIVRGFTLFQTVQLPTGDHTIELQYKPVSVLIGSIISGISLLFVIFCGFYRRKWSDPGKTGI
jgi:hypothetical protein